MLFRPWKVNNRLLMKSDDFEAAKTFAAATATIQRKLYAKLAETKKFLECYNLIVSVVRGNKMHEAIRSVSKVFFILCH